MKRSILLTALLAACGSKTTTHSGNGAKPPQTTGGQGAAYGLDAASLAGSDALKAARWTVIASIAGNEAARITDKDFDAVAKALRDVKVKSGDDVALAITIRDADGKLLATNVEADSAADQGARNIWNKECKGNVSSSFSLRNGINAKFNDADASVAIDLKLCDFSGFLVSGSVALEPAQEALKKHEVAFECKASEEPSYAKSRVESEEVYNVIGLLSRNDCRVGYTKSANPDGASPLQNTDGSFRSIEVPADASREAFKARDWSNFELRFDKHDKLEMISAEGLNQLGAMPDYVQKAGGDCHTFEFVRHYLPDGAAAGQEKETRVVLKRQSMAGNASWIVQNGDKPVYKRNITDQFENGAQITFYVHCTWYSQPSAALSTIAISN